VFGGTLDLAGISLELRELGYRPKRTMVKHQRIAAVVVEQVGQNTARLRAPDQRDVREARTRDVPDHAVVIWAFITGQCIECSAVRLIKTIWVEYARLCVPSPIAGASVAACG
jgi:hypothetical protein